MPKQDVYKTNLPFTPYYINQERLIDIFSILNGGYSTFREILTEQKEEKQNKKNAKVKAGGGFKLFNLGADISLDSTKDKLNGVSTKESVVHTVPSMLAKTLDIMDERKYLQNISNSKITSYITFEAEFMINSVEDLMKEAKTIFELSKKLINLNGPSTNKQNNNTTNNNLSTKEIDGIIKNVNPLFNGKEIIGETENYSVFGNIIEKNLYLCEYGELINKKLKCFAQIKNIYDKGTDLMKNTVFSKIKDEKAKTSFISAMESFTQNDAYDFGYTAMANIEDKKTYELDIIALFQ